MPPSLSNRDRVIIHYILANGDISTTELGKIYGITPSTAAQHLDKYFANRHYYNRLALRYKRK